MDCIFCQIVAGKVPGELIYQDEELVAFRDINPLAPTHLLVVTKRHIPRLTDVSEAESPIMGRMVNVANQLARSEGIAQSGYRLVVNCGQDGGQVIPHLHMHLLGGRRLSDALG
jgi:histidine triad (HIT) family protein